MILIPLILTSLVLIGICGLADAYWSATSIDYVIRKEQNPGHYLFPARKRYSPDLENYYAARRAASNARVKQDWQAIAETNKRVNELIRREQASSAPPRCN